MAAGEICGDIPLSWGDRWRYFYYGLRQIGRSLGQKYRVEVVRLDVQNKEVQSKTNEGASPLRTYTGFLTAQVIRQYLGEKGPICDLGCGSGSHSRYFEGLEKGYVYVGVDKRSHPSWPSLVTEESKVSRYFVCMNADNLGIATDSLTFTFSSSALEHVSEVQRAVEELGRATRSGAFGLHIVPGVWSLFLYLFHGYRRFSPRDIVNLFQNGGFTVERMLSLGGIPSFLLHLIWITLVENLVVHWGFGISFPLRKRTALRVYSKLLRIALRLDPFLPFAPAGYCVLVRKS